MYYYLFIISYCYTFRNRGRDASAKRRDDSASICCTGSRSVAYNQDMLHRKTLLVGYKTFFALLGLSAIVTEIATLVERGYFNPLTFFSYFTIQSNILVVVTLLLSALAVAAAKGRQLSVLRGVATVYIVVVGIGFSLLLAGVEGLILTAVPWDNIVLHYIIPAAVLIDFLIDRPASIRFATGLWWLIYPIVYVTAALIRGAITGWYPYPFLDPGKSSAGSIAVTILGFCAAYLVLIWVVTRLTAEKKQVAA